MVLQRADSIVRTMLSDTILALCRNTLSYEGEVCIEGLLGITVDQKEVFLVHLNETIQKEGYSKTKSKQKRKKAANGESDESSSQDSDSDSQSSTKKKRRRRKKSKDKDDSPLLEMNVESDNKRDVKDEDSGHSEESDGGGGGGGGGESVADEDSNISGVPVKSEHSITDNFKDNDEDDEIVFVKEEPKDPLNMYGQSHFAIPGTSHSGDSNFGQDPSLELGHLQELAFQLSGDMSSPAVMHRNMGPQSSPGSFPNPPPGGTPDQVAVVARGHYGGGGRSPYPCQICGTFWQSDAHLKRHMMKHTGERPFKCPICHKGFIQNCDMQRHMRVHTGEHPYRCNKCNKSFFKKHALLVHLEEHKNHT